MKKKFIFLVLVMLLIGLAKAGLAAMEISSPDFEASGMIPSKFTCDGENINPALKITNVPEGTKSLVLIMDDPDASGETWVHWIVYNLSPDGIIEQGEARGSLGINDFDQLNYSGPCPPVGIHRYFFKVYAVNIDLDLAPGLSKTAVLAVIQGRILDQAVLMGRYSRKR